MRRLWSWTNKQKVKLEKVKAVLNSLRKYWSLTLRQVYYQLVSQGVIENKTTEYVMLSTLLKHARLDGLVSWDAIEDRMREAKLNRGWMNKTNFVTAELYGFLTGYRRHLQQGQSNYIELWVEKDALSSIFQRVADPYCVPVCTCRGFSSVSFLQELRERILTSQNYNQDPILLYFGDFDPSGEEMLPAMRTTLEEEMGINGGVYKKIALTKEDITKYNLPHDPNAVKKTDTRYRRFVEKWGLYAVELDALPPDILEERIREVIEAHIDLGEFSKQKSIAQKEREEILSFKGRVEGWIDSQWEGQ